MICNTLSASSIKTYIQCPLKYYYTYEQGHRTEAEYLFFGTVIHKVLERWFQEDKDILHIYNEEWSNASIISFRYFQLGKDLLNKFVERNNKDAILTLGFEQNFEIEIAPEVKIKGIIDRIDVVDGETIEIVDYKTSFTALTGYELEDDVQLSMYDLAASLMYPEYSKRILTLDYLRYDKVRTQRTEEFRKDFKEWLIFLAAKIKNDNEPKGRINQYCNFCENKEVCSEYKKIQSGEIKLSETPDTYPEIWEEIQNINNQLKILEDRKKELQGIIKFEFESTQRESIPFEDGKELYQSGAMRANYRVADILENFPLEDLADLLTVRKGQVDKKIGKNKELKSFLEARQETYFVEPTLRLRKQK